ncbi:MAG: hypothetical protein LC723_14345 [Actinobacteria bacterium]|nr:hypothetical protein [Actinomycetota bacterium]
MSELIMKDSATGAEIDAILRKVIPVLEGDPTHHVIISALFLAAIATAPDLSFDEMQRVVEATSQYLVLCLTQIEDERRQSATSENENPNLETFSPSTVN